MTYSYLYVIGTSNKEGPVKLGFSDDPDIRIKQLQTGHAERLFLHHTEPVDIDKIKLFEKLLHRDLCYKRKRGEWFDISVAEGIDHIKFTIIQYDNDTADMIKQKIKRGMI